MSKKLIYLALAFGLTVGVAGGSVLKINFQSSGAPIPEGYLPDYGDPFGDRGNGWTYGWDQDIKDDARDRNNGAAPDQRYDTLNHLQKPGGDKIWEIALPNGTYDLFLVFGDPSYTDQINNFDVEGTVLTDPDGEDNFDEHTVTVELSDGLLTIKPAAGASNCKICFVDIESDVLTEFFSKARNPDPADGADDVTVPLLQWTAGDTAAFHDVYFGTNPTPGAGELIGRQNFTMYWHVPGLTPGTTYYWRIDEVEADGVTIHEGDVWSFMALSVTAWGPSPADGATDVMIDTQLSWGAGQSIMPLKHHVFFGTDEAAVTDGTGDTDKGILEETTYDPGLLKAETIYYWRVNEVETDGTEREGGVWSFETVAAGPGKILREWWFDISGSTVANLTTNARYPDSPDGSEFVSLFEGPVNWAEQYGSRLRGWLFVPETGDYTFWIAAADQGELWLSTDADPTNVVMIANTPSGNDPRQFDEFPEQKSAPQSLVGGERYYIEALMKENTISDNIAVAWSGPGIPVMEVISAEYVGATPYLPEKAYAPVPADGALDVPDTVTLWWQPGVKASQHDLYFGTDEAAVANADTTTAGIYRGRQALNSYTPPEALEWGQTYYWRIDEYNTDATISTGRIWSFTVADYLVIDDFESYDDYCNRIFYAYVDGWGHSGDVACGVAPSGGNGTGSTVGYLGAPYAEQTIVNGGTQSMPFEYVNDGSTGKALYSETQRTFEFPQDWTRRDVKALSLWFRGLPGSVGSFSYDPVTGIYTITADGSDIWDDYDEFHYAFKRLSGVGTIEAQVLSVGNTDPWAKAGVMIRETLDPNSTFAALYITPGNGCRFQARFVTGDDAISDSGVTQLANIQAPHWVKLERAVGGAFNAYDSNDPAAEGWHPLAWNTQTITMAADVYIGLALTSHNTDPSVVCTAEFSDVVMTGTVTGQWQSQDIGMTSNAAEQLYVVVEDSTGKSKVVNNVDPNVVLLDTWQEWNIDLKQVSDAGVNLQSVKKMYIGVGDRNTPKLGGGGMLYIDDIRLYRARCVPSLAKPDADFNGNCVVDYPDLEIMANEWLVDANDLQADLDLDNDVDFKDYAGLADTWLDELLWP